MATTHIKITVMPFGNTTYNKAYQNAITCLYNGLSRSEWNNCGIDEYIADEIWNKAVYDFIITTSWY